MELGSLPSGGTKTKHMPILQVATQKASDFVDPKFLKVGSVLTEWRGTKHTVVEYHNPVDKPGLDGGSMWVDLHPTPMPGGILLAEGMPDLYVAAIFLCNFTTPNLCMSTEEKVPWYLGGAIKGTYSDDFLTALGYVKVPNVVPLIPMKDIGYIDLTKTAHLYKWEPAVPNKSNE